MERYFNDWKLVGTYGVVACALVVVFKLDAPAIERVLIHAIDACGEVAASNGGH